MLLPVQVGGLHCRHPGYSDAVDDDVQADLGRLIFDDFEDPDDWELLNSSAQERQELAVVEGRQNATLGFGGPARRVRTCVTCPHCTKTLAGTGVVFGITDAQHVELMIESHRMNDCPKSRLHRWWHTTTWRLIRRPIEKRRWDRARARRRR
jgi:hypothetical protein